MLHVDNIKSNCVSIFLSLVSTQFRFPGRISKCHTHFRAGMFSLLGAQGKYSLRKFAFQRWRITRGLGALICNRFAAEGCNIAVNYVSNSEAALEIAHVLKRHHGIQTCAVQGVRFSNGQINANYSFAIYRMPGLQLITSDLSRKLLRSWED